MLELRLWHPFVSSIPRLVAQQASFLRWQMIRLGCGRSLLATAFCFHLWSRGANSAVSACPLCQFWTLDFPCSPIWSLCFVSSRAGIAWLDHQVALCGCGFLVRNRMSCKLLVVDPTSSLPFQGSSHYSESNWQSGLSSFDLASLILKPIAFLVTLEISLIFVQH